MCACTAFTTWPEAIPFRFNVGWRSEPGELRFLAAGIEYAGKETSLLGSEYLVLDKSILFNQGGAAI